MRKICIAILLAPALAWAQPKTADEWYKEGENQYLLGNFDKAIDAFKQGFSLETDGSKKAAYLYNVAQSYRQSNDCKNALFFYKRFLALKDADTSKPLTPKTRKDIDGWISELEVCVQQANSVGRKPPTTSLPPDGDGGEKPTSEPAHKDPGRKEPARKDVATATPSNGEEPVDDGAEPPRARGSQPRVLSARFVGGVTKISAGNIDVPLQATFGLIGGYPIPLGPQLTLEAGAAFTFTPVPYQKPPRTGMMGAQENAQLFALMANAGATYEVAPKFGLRGDLGLGALFFSNASESQFTDAQPTTGALSMFHLRVGVSAEYALMPNLILTAPSVAFTYSPPKDGLAKAISALTSFDFMVGLGYRM